LDIGKCFPLPQLIPSHNISLTLSSSVGNIIGPQTFRPKDAPRYIPAEITIICCWGVCLVDMLFIYWYCRRQNAKKAVLRAQPEYVKLENQEWLDLTDRENPEFVYSL
jgi:ACS family allantoate permease-like MFS transporter